MDFTNLNRKFEDSKTYIDESLSGFAEGIIAAFSSILDVTLRIDQKEVIDQRSRFETRYRYIASVPLSGSITGELFLCVERSDWLEGLSEMSGISIQEPDLIEFFNSCMQEIINTAGAQASVPIKKAFGLVTMLSPRLIEGQLFYPATKIHRIKLVSENGKRLEAFLSLDLMEQDLRVEHERLKRDSIMDDTGLFNKKHFLEVLKNFEQTFAKSGYFTVIFADINRLKYVNDTFGHEAGDTYISTAANIIKQSCRFSDFCFRVGGDELVILLPKCSLDDSKNVTDRIEVVMNLSQLEFNTPDGKAETLQVRMSIGVCSNSEGIDPKDVLSVADQRMEEDKKKWYESQSFDRRK